MRDNRDILRCADEAGIRPVRSSGPAEVLGVRERWPQVKVCYATAAIGSLLLLWPVRHHWLLVTERRGSSVRAMRSRYAVGRFARSKSSSLETHAPVGSA